MSTSVPQIYQRRHPQSTILYQVVQNYFEDWLANYFPKHNETLPGYVENEFRDYFKCGILTYGFARARCDCGTDYIIAFLTPEDVLSIVDIENPRDVIVQFGGQTPLKLSKALEAAGVPIIGTSPDAIDRAESRERFSQLVNKLDLVQPANGIVRSVEEGIRLANVFAYPLVVRPSYVLGGRAMQVVFNEKELQRYMHEATGVPLAKIAAKCMAGISLAEQNIEAFPLPRHYAVKQPVFPFAKFPGVDPVLGPEMKSTGEVMGLGSSFEEAFAKGQLGAGNYLPQGGLVFVSVRDVDKPRAVDVCRYLCAMGFEIMATRVTAAVLSKSGVPHQIVNKVMEGRPNIVDYIKNNEISMRHGSVALN